MLHWDGDQRIARLIKSPSHKDASVPFVITANGIRGLKGMKRKADNKSL